MTPRERIRGAALLLCLGVAAPPAALAQSANCESFKARVAAGIEAKGISGYSLELVRRGAPVPPGARSVGRCDGGAYTLMYRRYGGADASATASRPEAEAEPPSQAVRPAVAPKAAAASRPAPTPASAPARAPVAAVVPASTPTPTRTATPIPTPTPTPKSAPPPALSTPPSPNPTVAPTTAAAVAAPPAAVPAPAETAVATKSTTFDDVARRVAWVVAAVLVIWGGVRAWRWLRHRRYYDETGLPRGPRLTL
ncbi:MAG: DUF1161 domain-containing protein [Burkholderiaceae bacterium]